MSEDPTQIMPSTAQPSWGAWVTIVGVLGVAGAGIVAMLHFSSASEAVTVLAPLTGAILALVGTFFGVRTATVAQQKANEAAAIHAKAQPPVAPLPVIDGKKKAGVG
jgi:hypothetical protein